MRQFSGGGLGVDPGLTRLYDAKSPQENAMQLTDILARNGDGNALDDILRLAGKAMG